MYKKKIVDINTGEETLVDCSLEEIAEIESNIVKADAQTKEHLAKQTAKEALYAKLGLTADEVKLLLS